MRRAAYVCAAVRKEKRIHLSDVARWHRPPSVNSKAKTSRDGARNAGRNTAESLKKESFNDCTIPVDSRAQIEEDGYMLNNNDMQITAEIINSAKRVAMRKGATEDAAGDLVNEAVIKVLEGAYDASKGSLKSYLCKTVGRLAMNANRDRKRHHPAGDRLTPGSCSVNATDFTLSEGAISQTGAEGAILAGSDGRETAERRSEVAALVETLGPKERIFCEALAMGHTAGEAARMVGWSDAKASRKRREIALRLKGLKGN